MSTDELFLSHDEVLGYIEEFKKDNDYIYGYEKEEFGICPYITFYIYHQEDEVEAIANQVIDLYEEFEARIIDKPFKLRYRKSKSGASTWKNADKWKQTRLEMIEQMHESYKKYFVYFIAATTAYSCINLPPIPIRSLPLIPVPSRPLRVYSVIEFKGFIAQTYS